MAATVTQAMSGGATSKRLVSYVTPAGVDVAAVRNYARQKLIPAMVPSVIAPLPEMPLLPNGKVNRRGLPEPPEAGATTSPSGPLDFEPPRDQAREGGDTQAAFNLREPGAHGPTLFATPSPLAPAGGGCHSGGVGRRAEPEARQHQRDRRLLL